MPGSHRRVPLPTPHALRVPLPTPHAFEGSLSGKTLYACVGPRRTFEPPHALRRHHPLGHRRRPDRSGLRPAHGPAPRPRLAPRLPVRPRQRLPRPQRRTLAPARPYPPPPPRPADRDPRVYPAHRVRLARDRAALGLQDLLQARVPGRHDRGDDETRVDTAELQRVAERSLVPQEKAGETVRWVAAEFQKNPDSVKRRGEVGMWGCGDVGKWGSGDVGYPRRLRLT